MWLAAFLVALSALFMLALLTLCFDAARAEAPPGRETYTLPDGGVDDDGKPVLYYKVPVTMLDGSQSSIDVDAHLPLQFMECLEEPGQHISCLVKSADGVEAVVTL